MLTRPLLESVFSDTSRRSSLFSKPFPKVAAGMSFLWRFDFVVYGCGTLLLGLWRQVTPEVHLMFWVGIRHTYVVIQDATSSSRGGHRFEPFVASPKGSSRHFLNHLCSDLIAGRRRCFVTVFKGFPQSQLLHCAVKGGIWASSLGRQSHGSCPVVWIFQAFILQVITLWRSGC